MPTIFNKVVDVMVRHWESLLVEERDGSKISGDKGYMTQTAGRTIRGRDDGRQWAEEVYQRLTVKAKSFMPEMGMVASIDLGWIQSAFDFLTGLFD